MILKAQQNVVWKFAGDWLSSCKKWMLHGFCFWILLRTRGPVFTAFFLRYLHWWFIMSSTHLYRTWRPIFKRHSLEILSAVILLSSHNSKECSRDLLLISAVFLGIFQVFKEMLVIPRRTGNPLYKCCWEEIQESLSFQHLFTIPAQCLFRWDFQILAFMAPKKKSHQETVKMISLL